MTAAGIVIEVVRWWMILGAVVAAVFLTIGLERIDADSRGAYALRPLLIPGILLIWPLVLWRWIRLETESDQWAARYRPPRAVHLPVAMILALALAFAVISGLAVRQQWPAEIAPVQLSEAQK